MGWPPGIRAGVTEHVEGVTLRACGSGLAPPEVGPAASPSLRSLTKLVTLFGPSILFPLVGTYPFCPATPDATTWPLRARNPGSATHSCCPRVTHSALAVPPRGMSGTGQNCMVLRQTSHVIWETDRHPFSHVSFSLPPTCHLVSGTFPSGFGKCLPWQKQPPQTTLCVWAGL